VLLLLAAVAAVTVFVFLTAEVWHSTGATGWEWTIISRATRHPPPGANAWRSWFDPKPFALSTLAIACVAFLERRPRLGLSGLAGCLIAVVAAEHVLKPIIERRQVFRWYPWFHPRSHLGSLSFPSGHVAAAAACATFVWFVLERRTQFALVVFAIPALVAWSMIALELHYPADTIAGFILGILTVCATVLGTYKVFGRDETERATTDALPSGRDPNGSS
jgi:membrane-associated phospholipid phosphatase